MSATHLMAFSTFPSPEVAREIARKLVEAKLAACANILPQVESIYHWQGKIETADEVMVLFKTTHAKYAAFAQRLKELHPYKVPEVVAVDIAAGLPDYMQWVADSIA